ncbi:MAG TPA: helix-turn-helix transcriptional regulator [Myxococcaceae bacterium]|nr:helix-turn-helix transcriptional regulator [Myxococcaceae bacterium]
MGAPKPLAENDLYALALGKVIQTLRERRKWTQGQLAERVDLAQPQISRLEAGKTQPDFFALTRLARAFGMSLDELRSQVERALEIARKAASAAVPKLGPGTSQKRGSWWKFLGAGLLLGAVLVGVAAALEEARPKPKPKPEPESKPR